MVRSLGKDLPELLNFCAFPRRRTRPMVVFTKVESVDRVIYAIFNRLNQDWQNRILRFLHEQLNVTKTQLAIAFGGQPGVCCRSGRSS